MKRPTAFVMTPLFVLLALLPTWVQQPKEPPPENLTAILGGPVSQWKIQPRQGVTHDFTVPMVADKPVLQGGPNGTVLIHLTPHTADSEITIRCRFALSATRATSLWVAPGLKKVEDNGENLFKLSLSVPPGLDQESLSWNSPALPGQQPMYGNYLIRSLPAGRLTWPDMVRLRAEQDFASTAGLGNRWLTIRCVLREGTYQVYLDDRLLREARDKNLDPKGLLRLTLFEGAQLAAVRVRPLPPEDPLFEPVALGGYVNASRFKGDTLKRDTLPQPDKATAIKGIPFVFPSADEQGHDHIDLLPSWLQAGLLEGAFDGAYGDAVRWRGALERDPSRIRLRVRNFRYNRLHLIAAADGEPDTVPIISAQFFRAYAGFPTHFSARVPLFTAKASDVHALPVQLTGGTKGNLYLVTIPLEPEGLASYADLDCLEMELTKEVKVYRSYPDPIYYSQHGGGLPSGVHVFALTLERPVVDADLQPDRFAHIWTAPDKPSYTVKLRNLTREPQKVELKLLTTSHDGKETFAAPQTVQLPPGGEQAVKLALELKRYGYHRVELEVKDASGTRKQSRSLAFLHPDTRERGGWEEGKGPIFGFWDWGGGHETPGGLPRLEVMAACGCESKNSSFYSKLIEGKDLYPDEEKKFALSKGMITFFHSYQLSMNKGVLGVDWDPKKPAEMQTALVKSLRKSPSLQVSKINKPELAVFFAEPLLGPVSYMSLPEFYGDPPYQLTAEEKKNYDNIHAQFVTAARAIKKEWPGTKCLMPWGCPMFPIPFLRNSKEATELMDGPALDVVLFERLPEMQLHQVTLSSQLWQLKQEWLKTGKPWPNLTSIEGPGTSPPFPGAVTQDQEANHTIRALLILSAYGTTRHLGWPTPFACASSWGETHYGSGMTERKPLFCPKVFYSAYSTLTRQLNRMNYVKTLPTGSLTTFCLQFKHYKTGELLHVLWTIRGKRPVQIEAARGSKLTIFDSMDNAREILEKDGKVSFTATSAPCYVHGLTADAKITLGQPDHSDSRPDANHIRLAELGDGTWKMSTERDLDYEGSHAEFVRRFPGKFSIKPDASLPSDRGKALAIKLEKQDKERKVMPFYTTLMPPKPIVIPGQAKDLGLWVRAGSDWGRVVYCLRDARGEKWLSVGKKGEWNVDDVHCASQFCFDGWRYLRFELPANAGYDLYREAGTTWWGYYGPGDGIVDLPLSLEKIMVEQRTHVIAPTELQPVTDDTVLLAGLFAEYASAADKTEEVVRLSRVRMSLPKESPELTNPIRQRTETGVGEPTKITRVAAPEREPDGTRCLVYFEPVAGARSYEVWVSPYADGRGAVLLGKNWKEPGQLLAGLKANTDFYLFVAYTDKDGKPAKPSPGFKINLKDMFPMK